MRGRRRSRTGTEGKPFKPLKCRWCDYHASSRAKWRKDVEAHVNLDEHARKDAELAHNREHLRHNPFEAPLFQMPTIDLSADLLHLVFINIFATFFEKTFLKYIMDLDPEARQPAEAYLNSIGIPIRLVKSADLDDMKGSLTGRDAKVIIADAGRHVPALLHFAHAGKATVEAAVAATGGGEELRSEGFTWSPAADDEDAGEGGDEDDQDGEDRELLDAKSWDALLAYVHELRPFESDTESYREARAVAAFNAAAPMVAEYRRLAPNAVAAVCHVALCIVPRQVRAACTMPEPILAATYRSLPVRADDATW